MLIMSLLRRFIRYHTTLSLLPSDLMTRGVMHDRSLLMIQFTKICIISNVIFGSQVIFTLVRIIQDWLRISKPP